MGWKEPPLRVARFMCREAIRGEQHACDPALGHSGADRHRRRLLADASSLASEKKPAGNSRRAFFFTPRLRGLALRRPIPGGDRAPPTIRLYFDVEFASTALHTAFAASKLQCDNSETHAGCSQRAELRIFIRRPGVTAAFHGGDNVGSLALFRLPLSGCNRADARALASMSIKLRHSGSEYWGQHKRLCRFTGTLSLLQDTEARCFEPSGLSGLFCLSAWL